MLKTILDFFSSAARLAKTAEASHPDTDDGLHGPDHGYGIDHDGLFDYRVYLTTHDGTYSVDDDYRAESSEEAAAQARLDYPRCSVVNVIRL